MNKSLIPLLFAGVLLSGAVQANPSFSDGAWMVAGKADRQNREEAREQQRDRHQSSNKKYERDEKEEQEQRGYGYGYERRNPERVYDNRGRR